MLLFIRRCAAEAFPQKAKRRCAVFVDYARIFVKAGRGGNGCVSFNREKFKPFGGPDGGDGGSGGNIIIEASARLKTLYDVKRKPHIHAYQGVHGRGGKCFGKAGRDTVLKVPVGTLVWDKELLLADLARDRQAIVAARGGKGGKGNAKFSTRANRAPRIAERGEPGEEKELILELKLIADVGLMGYPNAGKSTLLNRLTGAHSKVADYPFTTLAPQLGVVSGGSHGGFVIADIPGLIEGAHAGKGLGDLFLRHLERTQIILHLIDLSQIEPPSPLRRIAMLNNELRQYGRELAGKRQLVVATKMDLPDARKKYPSFRRSMGGGVIAVSAVTGYGLESLVRAIERVLS